MANTATHPNSGIGFDFANGTSWDVPDNLNRRMMGDLVNKPVDFVQSTQPPSVNGACWANTSDGTYRVYISAGNTFSGWQAYPYDGMALIGRGNLLGKMYIKSGTSWVDYLRAPANSITVNRPVDFIQAAQPSTATVGAGWANNSNGTYSIYTGIEWQSYNGDGLILVGRGTFAGSLYIKSGNNWHEYLGKSWRESSHGYANAAAMSTGQSWLKGSGHTNPYVDNATLTMNTSNPNAPYINVLREGRYMISFNQLIFANLVNVDHRTEMFISGRVVDVWQRTTVASTQDTIRLSMPLYIFANQTVEISLTAGINISNLQCGVGRFSMHSI